MPWPHTKSLSTFQVNYHALGLFFVRFCLAGFHSTETSIAVFFFPLFSVFALRPHQPCTAARGWRAWRACWSVAVGGEWAISKARAGTQHWSIPINKKRSTRKWSPGDYFDCDLQESWQRSEPMLLWTLVPLKDTCYTV